MKPYLKNQEKKMRPFFSFLIVSDCMVYPDTKISIFNFWYFLHSWLLWPMVRNGWPVVPSILPKTGWAIAHPAHPPVTPMILISVLYQMPLHLEF